MTLYIHIGDLVQKFLWTTMQIQLLLSLFQLLMNYLLGDILLGMMNLLKLNNYENRQTYT